MQLPITLSAFLLVLATAGFSQEKTQVLDWTHYFKMTASADSLYQTGNFNESANAFSRAFAFNDQGFSTGDKYKAARAWAKIGQTDSAFANLDLEVEVGYAQEKQLKSEIAFATLHQDKRWKAILVQVKVNANKEKVKLGKYIQVKKRLQQVYFLDQKYRSRYQVTIDAFGMESEQTKELLKKMRQVDKVNLRYVEKVIDKYGWINSDTIGKDAHTALFLVIQHADSSTQEKYLPVLRQAVKEQRALRSQLAMLEDRVLLKRGRKQIYGTQLHWSAPNKAWELSPVEDEKNVDQRRRDVGLPPLRDYLKVFHIDYQHSD